MLLVFCQVLHLVSQTQDIYNLDNINQFYMIIFILDVIVMKMLILDPGLSEWSNVITLVRQSVCPFVFESVHPSVFKYLRDRPLVFSIFLHEGHHKF